MVRKTIVSVSSLHITLFAFDNRPTLGVETICLVDKLLICQVQNAKRYKFCEGHSPGRR